MSSLRRAPRRTYLAGSVSDTNRRTRFGEVSRKGCPASGQAAFLPSPVGSILASTCFTPWTIALKGGSELRFEHPRLLAQLDQNGRTSTQRRKDRILCGLFVAALPAVGGKDQTGV